MSSIAVHPLVEADVPALCSLYVRAFTDNEAYRYVFPPSTGDDGLRWLFDARVRMLLASAGITYLVAKEEGEDALGKVVGGVAYVPTASKPGFLSMMQHGLLLWPFLWGFDSLFRVLEIDAEMGQRSGYGGLPPWDASVALMAVLPGAQGRGIGTALMTALLERVDEAHHTNTGRTIAVGLDTQKEKNLAFYGRFGFVETRHAQLHGFSTWTMVRCIGRATDGATGEVLADRPGGVG